MRELRSSESVRDEGGNIPRLLGNRILSKIVFVLAYGAIISAQVYGMKEEKEPWEYIIRLSQPHEKRVQNQFANNPIWLHGFSQLHEQGIKGKDIQIAFLENGVDQNHSQFKDKQIKIIDCSQWKDIIGEDKAIVRENDQLNFRRLGLRGMGINKSLHGNHVVGVSLSQQQSIEYETDTAFFLDNPQAGTTDEGLSNGNGPFLYTGKHPGGCCPEAEGIVYTYSTYFHGKQKKLEMNGISILSIKKLRDFDLLNKFYDQESEKEVTLEKYYSNIKPPLTLEETKFIWEYPLDRSPIKAFEEALAGPAFAINWSSTPYFFMNPSDQYKVPMDLLNKFGELSEKNDKVIIFCANNQYTCLEKKYEFEFYKQIINHPILSKRVIFAVNVCPTTQEDEKKLGEICINGYQIPFKLYCSSNYPGESLHSICLSAVGSHIISGDKNNEYTRDSGTSESAPIITSLAALVKQKFPKISGPEVIQKLKDTALPLGEPRFTGLGYVWAPAALEIMEN
ncbi:MAG: S8 family serine peptidase [Candidatus Pacebacteria bacterium]|nr:S8 family serine peptidase [Candidatus Paceibacterota bacterium]